MTKCSVLPRGMGTLPAGSAVRVKSRFALYSPRGAVFVPRVAARFAVVLTLRFALAPEACLTPFRGLRLEAVVVLRFALFAVLRFAADFLAFAGRVLLAVRLVAMPWRFAKS